MDDHKKRSMSLADRVAVNGARFLASGGKPLRFGSTGVEYEALLVRKQDKESSLRLLTIAEEATSDIALILDVLLAQSRIMAEQMLELDRLRSQVEALRAERVATDVTKKVHEALLAAGRDGVGVEGFEFSIETEDSEAEERTTRLHHEQLLRSNARRAWSATADLGSVMDLLKGAHLAASDANKTQEVVGDLLAKRTSTTRVASRRGQGSLKVQRVVPKG